ncbi:sigma-70 family RNA polymerase sigma factor [Ekhidna sp. MALMAid0563]|uniref:RNA polymerase sigma factor n=1 Tax=Ekhidna sp. MALMAid0563 TaxID=3143937 RepID=UPI0032DF6FEA
MSLPNQQIDQDQLVARLRAKKADAFSYLYDNYSAAIYGSISRIINDEDVAQEVLQDAFMKFWDKIDQYDAKKGRFFTWMVNISRNLAIDKLRSKEMKKVGKTDTIENYVSGIEQSRLNHLNVDGIGLKETLATLREEERFILEMAYFKGYTQSEISDEFDIPLGTVKTRLRMGLKNLRKVLQVE